MAFLNYVRKKIKPTHRGLEVSWSRWLFHGGDTLSKKYDFRSEDGLEFQLAIQMHFNFQRGLMDQTFFIMEHDRNVGFETAYYICKFSAESDAGKSPETHKNVATLKTEVLDDGRVFFTTTDAQASDYVRDMFASASNLVMAIYGTGDDPILIIPIPNDDEFRIQCQQVTDSLPTRGLEEVIDDLSR